MMESNNKKSLTFAEIALALASDYESIYVINSLDDSYVEYVPKGNDKELVINSLGEDFYEDTIHNCKLLVYPEDQESFLAAFNKERVIEALKDGKSFSLNYRLVFDGVPYHYFLKTIKSTNDNIVIGVQNIDEQRKREIQSNEELLTYRHIGGALASRYEAIYYVNTETDGYIRFSSSDDYAKLGTTVKGDDFFSDCDADIRKYVHKEDVDYLLSEIDKKTLLKNLESNRTMSFTYRQVLGDGTQFVRMNIVRAPNDDKHIVLGVLNVDLQIKHEQELEEENKLFNEVAMALASRYEVIYRVNIVTGEYYEYSASEKYSKLKVGMLGEDFFGDTQENMKRDIYIEDYPMMAQAMDKDNLLGRLNESGKVYINYRLNLDGRPQYMSLIVMRSNSNSENIIVALENVDDAKRKEIEYEATIITAMDMANKDALTSVKNKHAYVSAEMQLDVEIESDKDIEFAIVVCDINGLKQVNDEQGHSAGDTFIKDASAIICEVFDHSPVFRIGGDEFVVLLRGSDYENRLELLKSMHRHMLDNKRKGLVTIAFGMAEYNAGTDNRVQDVFERADNSMYENKSLFKNLPADREAESVESYSFVRFYELYEQLLTEMVNFDDLDPLKISELLTKISYMFRLSKGDLRVYKNPQEEREGKGEVFIPFDTHEKSHEILSFRVVTSVLTSATIKVFMADDAEPLSSEELEKVELVMKTTLSFVSRNRFKDVVYELAYHDEFGYPNLRFWNKSMIDVLHSPVFGSKAFIRYNLRHFVLINKEFGRRAGDRALKLHFTGLKNIIGEGGFLGRLGGDNFIGYCDKTVLPAVIEYLTNTRVRIDDNNSVTIKSSAGVFEVGSGFRPDDPGDLMEKLTMSFVFAQNGGKEHIVFFDESLLQGREKQMRVQQMFMDALADEEFVPYYQPKVDVKTGRIVGGEALCRWIHDGKVIPPMEFIPALEQTNDICKLDLYMLEHVCQNQRAWLDGGENRMLVPMSINFSRKHIMNLDLPDTIVSIMDKYQIPHYAIEVELTETTSDVEFSDLRRIVSSLRDKGICVSIDDFGMGFSSLNILKGIPWTTVKIDKGFLPEEGDAEDSEKNIMFKSVVSMSKALGFNCVAEGVETEYQVELMRRNGCDIAQGYYYDKPLPKLEFESRLITKQY